MSGQSITDRALAAKHTVVGSSLAKSVCKATTEEVMGPKRKHLEYLLHCTNEPNVSIPQMANLLFERTQNSSWVVVFKALVTIHNLLNYGNERFMQYLASSNCTFNLDSFYDRSNGMPGYSMSTYVRRYAKYLNQKGFSYRQMAFDFCRAKRGKDEGLLRTMNTEQLLKALPLVQAQFDALIEFDVAAGQLTNGVISAAFMLLFKDLIRLYASYNDGIINLLGQYFDMNKKNCREAFEIYKLFLVRVDKVSSFFKVAETVGVDKGDIPDLAKAPGSLIEALEQHLISLENPKKASVVSKPLSNEMPHPSPVVAAAAAPASTALTTSGTAGISDDDRKRILEEEQRMLDTMKQQNVRASTATPAKSIPVATSSAAAVHASLFPPAQTLPYPPAQTLPYPPVQPVPTANVMSVTPQKPAAAVQAQFNPFDPGLDLPPIPASYDLLGLQQPVSHPASSSNGFSFPANDDPFLSQPVGTKPSPLFYQPPETNMVDFGHSKETMKADLFGQSTFSEFDEIRTTSSPPLGSSLLPSTNASVAPPNKPTPQLGAVNVNSMTKSSTPEKQKMISTDLDKSLATIAGNLSIQTPDHYRRTEHQWTGSNGEKRLTGATTTGNQWMQTPSSPSMFPGARPVPVTMVGVQAPMMMGGMQYPTMIPAYPMSVGQPAMMNPGSASQNNPMFASQPVSNPASTTPAHQPPPNDPFGALL